MRLLYVLLLLIMVGCSNAPKEVLIDDFEGPLNQETVDYGSSDNSTLSVSPDRANKVCGQQALKLTYELKPTGYMWAARGYNLDVKGAGQWLVKPEEVAWEKYEAISLQMYGQGNGQIIAFDLKDKGGEIWRFVLDDEVAGWREIICPLEQFFPREDWQPETAERNQVIDFPILSFQFEPRSLGVSECTFDCLKVIR